METNSRAPSSTVEPSEDEKQCTSSLGHLRPEVARTILSLFCWNVCWVYYIFFPYMKYAKSMCCVAFVNFIFFFFFSPKSTQPTSNRRYHTREINVKPDWMNEKDRSKYFDAGEEEKKDMMRKAWLAKPRQQYFGKHAFQCFNGRFLRTCFFADGVCTRNSISLDLLELEPFCFFHFHQKWFLHTITEGYM